MAQERLSVRKIKDVLRLHLVARLSSRRQLARAVGCSKTAVSDCLRRAAVAGMNAWEAIAELDEIELEKRLYPSARDGGAPPKNVRRPIPDWAQIREELARRDHQITLALLWQEYKTEQPNTRTATSTPSSRLCIGASRRSSPWCCANRIVAARRCL